MKSYLLKRFITFIYQFKSLLIKLTKIIIKNQRISCSTFFLWRNRINNKISTVVTPPIQQVPSNPLFYANIKNVHINPNSCDQTIWWTVADWFMLKEEMGWIEKLSQVQQWTRITNEERNVVMEKQRSPQWTWVLSLCLLLVQRSHGYYWTNGRNWRSRSIEFNG